MRRAGIFFLISSVLFFFSLFLGNGSELQAGIISISAALFYVIFPIPATKLLSLLIIIPLGILFLTILLFGIATLLAICILELILPYIVGYYVIVYVYQLFGSIPTIIATILFITLWFMIGKYQWRLIRNTWNIDFFWNAVSSLGKIIENIWEGAGKIGESIVR